jgi:hypothetical protein
MAGPFIPPTPDKTVDSSPLVDLDDDFMDKFDNHYCMADEESTSVEGVVADGFDSDFKNKFPDGVPCACTISHFLHDNNNDQDGNGDGNDDDDDDNDNDDNLVCQMYRSNQVSTSNLLGCNKYYKCNVYTSNSQSK